MEGKKEFHNLDMWCWTPCKKTYYVIRVKNGFPTIYEGDVSGIINNFILEKKNNELNYITLIILGNLHTTYPQPPHITVMFEYEEQGEKKTTGKKHYTPLTGNSWERLKMNIHDTLSD